MSLDGIQGGAEVQPEFDAEAGAEPPPAAAPDPEAAVSRLPSFVRPTPVAATQSVGPAAEPPEETVRDFYEAFTNRRFDDVAAIYAPDVHYHDPLFDHHDGSSTIHMWRTLLAADQLKMGYEVTGVSGDTVTGRWTADYNFHGRPVHEVSESRFTVKDGKIVAHEE